MILDHRNISISQPSLGIEEWEAVKEPILSGWVLQGPKVLAFEKQFAAFHSVKHAIAVSNCSTALQLAVLALDLEAGDEVLVPSFTWVSTVNAIESAGLKPIFVDVETDSYNISIEDAISKKTSKTKAIIPVHLFGLGADMNAIKTHFPELKIIEDAACAAGSKIGDTYVGNFGEMACYSFHPRKSITTGEGGMITTNNDKIAEKLRILRNCGLSNQKDPKTGMFQVFDLGYNFRLTDIQAAIGLVQLSKIKDLIRYRQQWAEFLTKELAGIEWLQTPNYPDNYEHTWQSYVVLINEDKSTYSRNELMDLLAAKGIATRPGTHAVHMLDYYKNKYNFKDDDFPNAAICNNRTLAIPLHNKMVEDDFIYIVNVFKNI